MTDRELLEFIAAQVGNLTKDVSELKQGQKALEMGQKNLVERQTALEERQKSLEVSHLSLESEFKKLNVTIDHEIKPKIDVLFDGWKQNTQQLERIETEVAKHEEVIIRRVK